MEKKQKSKNIFKKLFITVVIILIISFTFASVYSQSKYYKAEGSVITVSGTSTFKKWEIASSQMSSDADFEFNKAGKLMHLNSLSYKLEVKSLTSGDRGLDKNAHEALKIKKHPFISFRTVSPKILSNTNGSYTIRDKGRLTIAGLTKEKTIETVCVRQSNGSLSCTGNTKLLMSEFGVKPPTFMMGAMKTGDEVTISYKINYKP